jgi:hypothetical protein
MPTITVTLRMSLRRFQAYYEGVAENVVARAADGRVVQFPARVLRPFVMQSGIQGTFELTVTARYQFVSIRRLTDERESGGSS